MKIKRGIVCILYICIAYSFLIGSEGQSLALKPYITSADQKVSLGVVQAYLFTSHQKVKVGDRIIFLFALDIQKDHYLYAPNPDIEFLIDSKVEVHPKAVFQPKLISTPKSKVKYDSLMEKNLNTFQETVWFPFEFTIPKGFDQKQLQTQWKITVQACNATTCLAPVRKTLNSTIEISSKKTSLQHQKLFKTWRASKK